MLSLKMLEYLSYILIVLLIGAPFALVRSYLLIMEKGVVDMLKICRVNSCILAVYVYGISCLPERLTGHDEYGLSKLLLWILSILVHIYLVFAYTLYYSKKTFEKN